MTLVITRIVRKSLKRAHLQKIFASPFKRYLFIGVWNTAFSFLVLIALNQILHNLLSPTVIFSISSIINILQGYFTLRVYVWKSKNNIPRELKTFIYFALLNYIVNIILIKIFVEYLDFPFIKTQVVISCLYSIFNFYIGKKIIFTKTL